MSDDPQPRPGPFDLRAALADLEFSQSGFARRMKELGDDRPHKGILRTIQRMVAGESQEPSKFRVVGVANQNGVDFY